MKNQLRMAVMEFVGNQLCLMEYAVSFCLFGEDFHLMRVLYREKVFSVDDLSKPVHERLKILGRACYKQHLRGEYPDHTISPQAFAYALQHGEFTFWEKWKINFDHGEHANEFVSEYNENDRLHGDVMKQLQEMLEAPST